MLGHLTLTASMSFENAAVTKGLMIGSGLASILVGLFDVKHYFHLQLVPHLSKYHQYWRLALHHFAFSNSSDLFVSELILFNVGIQIERQFGSVKFASYVVVSTMLITILEFLSLLAFNRLGLNHYSMGPAALVFSMLYQYSRIVPSTYSYRIFGIPLNNKSFTYFLALQMAVSRPPSSIAVALIGLLVGQMYRSDLANLKTYRLPPSVIKFSTRVLLPLLGALRPPRRSNRALPDDSRSSAITRTSNVTPQDEVITTARPAPSTATSRLRNANDSQAEASNGGTGSSVMREWVDELTGRSDQATAALRVPSEADVLHLTSIFPDVPREDLVRALQQNSSFELAVETLLRAQA